MKLLFLFLSVLIISSSLGQQQLINTVEFALKDKNVILYKDIRYHAADTLERLSRFYEVYIVKVDSCVPNFCRVKSYSTLPYLKNKQEAVATYWVENKNLESALQGDFSVYREPSSMKKDNLMLRVEDYSDIYFKVDIITIKNEWVKIQFKINDQSLIGWVVYTNLCPLKHTTCNYSKGAE